MVGNGLHSRTQALQPDPNPQRTASRIQHRAGEGAGIRDVGRRLRDTRPTSSRQLAFETNETTVQTVDDVLDEDETFLILMVSNGLDEAITINPKYAFVTIVDDDQVPDAPTGLTVDNAGPTTVTLSWTAPSNEGTPDNHRLPGRAVNRQQHPSLQPTSDGSPALHQHWTHARDDLPLPGLGHQRGGHGASRPRP